MLNFLTFVSTAFAVCKSDSDCTDGSCLIAKSCDSHTYGGCVPVDLGSNNKVYMYSAPKSGQEGNCFTVNTEGGDCDWDTNGCEDEFVCGHKGKPGAPEKCVKPCTVRHTEKAAGAGGWLACPTDFICANTLWCNNKTECVEDKSDEYSVGISEVGLEESIHFCEPKAVTGSCDDTHFCAPPLACINGTCQSHNIECSTNADCLYQTDTRYCVTAYDNATYPEHKFYKVPENGEKGNCINQPNKITSPPQAERIAAWEGITCDGIDNGCENACRMTDNKCVAPCKLGDECPAGKTCLDVSFCSDNDHSDCALVKREETDIAKFIPIVDAAHVGTCMSIATDIDACDLYESGCAVGSYCELKYTRP